MRDFGAFGYSFSCLAASSLASVLYTGIFTWTYNLTIEAVSPSDGEHTPPPSSSARQPVSPVGGLASLHDDWQHERCQPDSS